MGITRKPHGTGNLKAEASHSAQPELKEIGTLKRIVEVCWDKSTSADPDTASRYEILKCRFIFASGLR